MKLFLLALFCIPASSFAAATSTKSPSACLRIAGTYDLPKAQDENALDEAIRISQNSCRTIKSSYCVGYSFTGCPTFPPGKCSSARSCESVRAVNFEFESDRVIEAGNELIYHHTTHGDCKTDQMVLMLDGNRNLVRSSSDVICQDGFKGAYSEVNPRSDTP